MSYTPFTTTVLDKEVKGYEIDGTKYFYLSNIVSEQEAYFNVLYHIDKDTHIKYLLTDKEGNISITNSHPFDSKVEHLISWQGIVERLSYKGGEIEGYDTEISVNDARANDFYIKVTHPKLKVNLVVGVFSKDYRYLGINNTHGILSMFKVLEDYYQGMWYKNGDYRKNYHFNFQVGDITEPQDLFVESPNRLIGEEDFEGIKVGVLNVDGSIALTKLDFSDPKTSPISIFLDGILLNFLYNCDDGSFKSETPETIDLDENIKDFIAATK